MFIKEDQLKKITISLNLSIKQSIKILEEERKGIVIIVNEKNKILGTITDGDIRRAILRGISLDEPLSKIMNSSPVKSIETSEIKLKELSLNSNLENIPIINKNNELIALYSLTLSSVKVDGVFSSNKYNVAAFIMAGGEGKRMRPLTLQKPKPLVHIGKKSLIERNIELIQAANINDLFISVNYMAEKIIEEVGNGKYEDMNIQFIREEKKLGTGAPIGLIPDNSFDHILVINADILTTLSLSKLIDAHIESKSDASIVVSEKNTEIPFGVIEIDHNEKPIKIVEKPKIRHFCAAGIYILNAEVALNINPNEFRDMPDILNDMIDQKKEVNVFPLFPILETWSDIGTKEALDEANKLQ